MPRIEATRTLPVDAATAFAVSQTHGEVRLRWDPFIRAQRLEGGDRPAKGVRTITTSRHRLEMVTEYSSFRPPTQVGMRMLDGPWFFSAFGAGWSFRPFDDTSCETTWRYTFSVRPTWLAPIADRIGVWLLQRDIDRRIDAYARACGDPQILALLDDVE